MPVDQITIRRYQRSTDEQALLHMIDSEEGWDYTTDGMIENYKTALQNSITYVACSQNNLCGYSRSIDDNGFYIYVCDLLVKPAFRGMQIGKMLMEHIYSDFPDRIVYVLSGVDAYYRKLHYPVEGTVFQVTKQASTGVNTSRKGNDFS